MKLNPPRRDAGIKTALTVTGHYKQTGSYLEVTFVLDGTSPTSVRVSAYEEKRYKGLKTEPWSTPKVNAEQSEAEAAKLNRNSGGSSTFKIDGCLEPELSLGRKPSPHAQAARSTSSRAPLRRGHPATPVRS